MEEIAKRLSYDPMEDIRIKDAYIKNLQAENAKLNDQVDILSENNKKYKNQIYELNEENQRLKEEIEDYKAVQAEMEYGSSLSNDEIFILKQRIKEFEERIHRNE